MLLILIYTYIFSFPLQITDVTAVSHNFLLKENIEDTKPMQELTEAKDIAKYCTESLLAVVEGLAKFAKKLAEFRNLDLNDQVKIANVTFLE